MNYSLTPYQAFMEHLSDTEYYSIPALRAQARMAGFCGTELTRLTESLIWNRHFHDFPGEGDRIETVFTEKMPSWTGARWKSLLPTSTKVIKNQPSLIQKVLKWVA